MKRVFIILIGLCISQSVSADDPAVKVIALFTNKAMLMIDGKNIIMEKGEVVQGIKLISASGRAAVIRLKNGKQQTLGLNQSIQSTFKQAEHSKLTVYSNKNGMFLMSGKINGRDTRFLLDTGASFISMSSTEANRLKLPYNSGRRGLVQTASETVAVWHITLDKVKVGGISVSNVDAVVLKGSSPEITLLGMSFLKHVKLQRNGIAMTIEQKY